MLKQPPGEPLRAVGAGRYYDDFVREGGEWRFEERVSLFDLSGDVGGFLRAAPRRQPSLALRGPSAHELQPLPPPPDAADAIEALIYTYAERIDLADLEGVGALFAHGPFVGESAEGEDYALRGEALAKGLRGAIRLYEGNPRTKHLTTNVAVEVDEEAGTGPRALVLRRAATDAGAAAAADRGRALSRPLRARRRRLALRGAAGAHGPLGRPQRAPARRRRRGRLTPLAARSYGPAGVQGR